MCYNILKEVDDVAKNTEINAKEYNKRARAKYDKKLKQCKFRLNKKQTEQLQEIADKKGTTIPAIAKMLVLDYIEKQQKPDA